jgi:hypothetical protein
VIVSNNTGEQLWKALIGVVIVLGLLAMLAVINKPNEPRVVDCSGEQEVLIKEDWSSSIQPMEFIL